MSKKLSELIPSDYYPLFKARKESDPRFYIYKGGRASCKSSSISIYLIVHVMKNPLSNVVVIRANENTLRDSVYEQCKWAINQLGATDDFRFMRSPLEIVYKPTGQRIIFKGANNPQSITSIKVSYGVIDTVWYEEAFQLSSEKQFNMISLSFRGEMPEGYKIREILSLNPWRNTSWIKGRFFDKVSDNVYSTTTTYKCNKWLSPSDIKVFEEMKVNEPTRYEVEGKGNWGVLSGLIYSNWYVDEFNHKEVNGVYCYGGDFGYVNSYTALVQIKVDEVNKILYICNEVMYARRLGIKKARGCSKGKDSVMYNINNIKEYKIVVHPSCVNAIIELENYMWQVDSTGKEINKPIKDYDHLMDAIAYGLQTITKNKAKVFSGRGLNI